MSYTTINKHTDYFNTKLYTGNGTDATSITGVGFQPDWVWIKDRDSTGYHNVFDAVRGATKRIHTNTNGSENTTAESLQSFNSDGFTVGTNSEVNTNNDNIVAWNWKANGSGSANTDGSINSTVSVNQTAGFSIVKWTGTGANATIGHGLGAVPKMIICKSMNSGEWGTYHVSTGATKYLYLNATQAKLSATAVWNDTAPTSSVFSVGTSGASNESGEMIAYCFSDVRGYQKIGNYCGQTTGENPFVHLGFKPQFILIKNQDSGTSWCMFDTKRQPGNDDTAQVLHPNLSNAEDTGNFFFDILSNGFKVRTTSSTVNGDGNMMIYYAVGQSLVGDNNVPCTAR